ncbi:MAG: cohesin domain-containing protein, partial [Candidatus Promineifilaceae bacterium]
IPANNSLSAVTLDITFDPAIVSFDGCTSNESSFDLGLCALQEDGRTVSISALAVSGLSGETLLGEIGFTGKAEGVSNLSLIVQALEDGSGGSPRLRNGRMTVRRGGTQGTEKDIPLSGKVVETAVSIPQNQSSGDGKAPEVMVPSTIVIGSGMVAPGESVTVPITITVPAANSFTAATIRIQYDPTVLTFDSCSTNTSDFDFNLCNRSDGDGVPPDVVSYTAIAAFGVNGTLPFGTITFVGNQLGTSSLTIVVSTYEDGSGEPPVTMDGTMQVQDPTAVTASNLSAAGVSSKTAVMDLFILLLIATIFAGCYLLLRRKGLTV